MPRTRTISDTQVLDATITFVGRHGVDKLTFASLSEHIGLSPATLVQRFGSKKGLLAAVTRYCLQSMLPTLNKAESENVSPLNAVYAAFESMAKAVTTVNEFANGQVFFYLALTDPEMNTLLNKSMTEARIKIEQLLNEAMKVNEIKRCDTTSLALTLQSMYEGAITTWLVYQQDDVQSWVSDRLTQVIEPYKITS